MKLKHNICYACCERRGAEGRIGKSTIAGNLAGEFVTAGYRVLVLDADPQHSLAAWAKQGEGLLLKRVPKWMKGTRSN